VGGIRPSTGGRLVARLQSPRMRKFFNFLKMKEMGLCEKLAAFNKVSFYFQSDNAHLLIHSTITWFRSCCQIHGCLEKYSTRPR
jgi:hypothetical protein